MIDNRSQYFLGNRRAVAEALVARGVEVHAATLTERPGVPETIEGAGVRYHHVPTRLGAPGLIPAVSKLIRTVDADLVHAFTLRAGFITSLAALTAPRRPLFVSDRKSVV